MKFKELKFSEVPTGLRIEVRETTIGNVIIDFYDKGDIIATRKGKDYKYYEVV